MSSGFLLNEKIHRYSGVRVSLFLQPRSQIYYSLGDYFCKIYSKLSISNMYIDWVMAYEESD